MCKRFKGRVCSRFRGRDTVLPGSWIYLQSVDFFFFFEQKIVCGWIKAKSRVLWIFLLINKIEARPISHNTQSNNSS